MKTVFIYALKDPRDGAVRYIGKADDPNYRLRVHLRSKPGTHKAHWIGQLKELSLVPVLDVIDEVPETQWEFFERCYIKVYRESGASLTNIADGGDGGPLFAGHKHSEESKQRIGKKAKGRGAGVPKSPEHRANLSKALLGGHLSDEHKEAISAGTSGEKNHNFGKKLSPERCLALSVLATGRVHSPESIAKGVAKLIGQKRSPEQRARMSAGMKGVKLGRPWTEKQRASFEARKAKNVV